MAFGIPPIRIRITGVDEFSKTLGSVSRKLEKTGKSMQGIGKTMTRNVTLPTVAAGAAILKVAGGFESTMKQVEVLTGATGDDLERLTSKARELGATTQFSASQAAEGMNSLAMAGLSVDEIYGSIGGSLQLAAASGLELGVAADYVTNIMTPFGKASSDLIGINDALAHVFSNTNTTMSELAEAMTYVGSVAGPMGLTINETSAALGLMSKAGIKASQAGTSLRGILAKISSPSKEAVGVLSDLGIPKSAVIDSEGNVRSLIELVKAFEDAGANTAQMLQIFGQRAGPGMAALVGQGSAELGRLTKLTYESGRAQEIAEKRMEGLFGSLRELVSALQELAISIGESGLLDDATKLTELLTSLVRKFGESSDATKRFVTIVAGIAATVGPVLVAIGSFLMLTGKLGIVVAKIAPALVALKGVIVSVGSAIGTFLLSPITLVLAAVSIWLYNFHLLRKNWSTLVDAFRSKFSFLQTLSFFFQDIADSLSKITKKIPFLGGLSKFFSGAAKGFGLEASERAAERFANSGANVQTNNAEIDVNVRAEPGTSVRTERKSGKYVRLRTDMGLAFIGG